MTPIAQNIRVRAVVGKHTVGICYTPRRPNHHHHHPAAGRYVDLFYTIRFNTRNSSEDEITNVNFLYDDIVHALQNTIDSCINSARDQHG